MRFTVEIIAPSGISGDNDDNDRIVLKIYLNNSIDINSSKELFLFLKKIINGGIKKLLFDIKDLEYIDSMGIGILIKLTKILRQKKGDLVLINATDSIRKILSLLMVQEFLRIVDSEEEAHSYFLC